MKTKIGFILVVLLFITGCANISTLSRTTILPPRGDGPVTGTGPQSNQVDYGVIRESGLAIHLDAPQRVVLSKNGKVCAEPSPDALQAFAASQGLSIMTPSSVSIQLANALSTNAGSIGLRTQSITLMREILYRICESAYSGWIGSLEVAQMTQRAQELTLGVLAIEQLTGAVKAQQVAIDTKANANASANLRATGEQLQLAKDDERRLNEADQEAQKNLAAQQEKVGKLKEKSQKPPKEGDSKDGADTTTSATDELEREESKLKSLKGKADDTHGSYLDAQRATKIIQENLGKARSRASAEAEGTTKFSGAESVRNIGTDNATQYISWATNQIVSTIINKDHIVDSCITLLNQYSLHENQTSMLSELGVLAADNSRKQVEGIGPAIKHYRTSRELTAEEKEDRLRIKNLCMVVIATRASVEAAEAAVRAAEAEKAAAEAAAKAAAPASPSAGGAKAGGGAKPGAAAPEGAAAGAAKRAGEAAEAAGKAAASVAERASKAIKIE